MRPLIRAALLAALLLTAAGCASGDEETIRTKRASGLVGDWRLASLTDRGKPVPLPTSRPVTISFDRRGQASWDDGVNTAGSTYAVSGEWIRFTHGVATAVGYGPGSPELLTARAFDDLDRPRFTLADDELTLRAERYEFGFIRQSRGVLAGAWRVTDMTEDGAEAGLVPDKVPTWQLGRQGGEIHDGCNTHSLRYEVTEGRLRVTDDMASQGACAANYTNSRLAVAVEAMLSHSTTYRVDGDRLTLTVDRFVLTLERG